MVKPGWSAKSGQWNLRVGRYPEAGSIRGTGEKNKNKIIKIKGLLQIPRLGKLEKVYIILIPTLLVES